MFSRIDTVLVNVKDLEDARHWYQETLELEEIFDGGNHVVFKVGQGETPITIMEGETGSTTVKAILFSDAIEETQLKLKGLGVEVGSLEQDGTVTFFTFKDPYGNPFEVCHF
ncbi:VOC family protein [Rossellomorea vietnamensis]|uniref:VOC family protein n=1 Tax=Rossellomorea vietnamensis TaxID=218284 RepID=A0A5D4ME37_9BACI|nr:VOC family protein [Rossellomorea vietnamensis]TYR99295.1 VOC family protein [Rossellomorea vietnamensis]